MKVKPNKGEDVPKGQRSKHVHANQNVRFILLEVCLIDQIYAVRNR